MSASRLGGTSNTVVASALPTSGITSSGSSFSSDDTATAVTATGSRFRVTVKFNVGATKDMRARLAVSGGTLTGAAWLGYIVGGTTSPADQVTSPSSPITPGNSLSVTATTTAVFEFEIAVSAVSTVTFTPAYAAASGGSSVGYRHVLVEVLG